MSIEWRNGQPYSNTFDDIYFSTDDGLQETDYVFVQGNQLETRWYSHYNNPFTIIETGFGTGLNFACACEKWLSFLRDFPQKRHFQLHFISVEKHPLSHHEIATALQAWPTLAPIIQAFLSQYETALNTHKAVYLFDETIKLTLLHGDAATSLGTLNITADAWFLDGFAPSKNPAMWSKALFKEIARLSKPYTTFATFTSAGVVKRGLMEVGFMVKKQAGFGKKREMLTGVFAENDPSITS